MTSAWSAAGLVLALLTAAAAVLVGRRAHGSYYAQDVYSMTRGTHGRYAAVCLVLAAAFAASFFVSAIPAVLLLAIQIVVSIFYGTSFLRGFSDEE